MKKYLLLIAFACMTLATVAQNGMYSFMLHDMGDYQINIENVMRQHDGNILVNLFVGTGAPGQTPVDVGNVVYKISPFSHAFTDSLLIENPFAPYCLYASDPRGEGNIRANFEYAEECDSTFLRVCYFPDNDLHINHDEDVVVPVCDGVAWGEFDSHFMDCRGDLIMKYYKIGAQGGYDVYMLRCRPDGTIVHQTLFMENDNGPVPRMGLLKESPLQYYQWKTYYENNLAIMTIDSLLHWDNTIVVNKILHEESLSDTMYLVAYEHFNFNHTTEVVPIGENDMLVAAPYVNDTNFDPTAAEYGVAVAKYDMRTLERKGLIVFNDFPGQYNEGQCLGLKKTTDGSVYFMYEEEGYPLGTIIVVRMDADLNVEWIRSCKTDITISAPLRFPVLYEDEQGVGEVILWVGYGRKEGHDKADLFCFFLNHDGTVGTNEAGIEIRPYAYYPNPAQDQLRLQYSPDVQPKTIEFYDLQGRLVRSQNQGLESVDMQGLASGQYLMKVTLEDGKSFTDKVVKE
jgi:hypothetical protein